ncbi:hypothetical protein [Cytobacillus oceanisediminis]|uniref:Uncharacterized protein n=1 Tax=Cytobacillus oceanisediminis TaxID=665099 RepID=A0A562JPM6_9BACI|nr:hypothetical protein [Cytobacillus oceanisediminis]TWH85119.1 hypothetical protein IQ19_03355 [Cytobacillus oceanisediminis]
MSGAWILIILIAVIIISVFVVQAVTDQGDHPILTQKEIIEALKKRQEDEKADRD